MSFESYNFDEDENFQKGLENILTKLQSDNCTKEEALLKAKKFYFEKVIQPKLNKQSDNNPANQSETDEDQAPRLSLQEITELISSGKPIPGIKTIPLKINEEQPKTSNLNPRKKPWEK